MEWNTSIKKSIAAITTFKNKNVYVLVQFGCGKWTTYCPSIDGQSNDGGKVGRSVVVGDWVPVVGTKVLVVGGCVTVVGRKVLVVGGWVTVVGIMVVVVVGAVGKVGMGGIVLVVVVGLTGSG